VSLKTPSALSTLSKNFALNFGKLSATDVTGFSGISSREERFPFDLKKYRSSFPEISTGEWNSIFQDFRKRRALSIRPKIQVETLGKFLE